MTTTTMTMIASWFLFIYFSASGAVLEFYQLKEESLSVLENHYASVMFGMNSSVCSQLDTAYRVMVNTRTRGDSIEYDGTVTYLGDTCTATPFTSVRCITPTGPAELHRRVNRSHVAVQWNWKWKDTRFSNFTTMRKELTVIVSCTYSVCRSGKMISVNVTVYVSLCVSQFSCCCRLFVPFYYNHTFFLFFLHTWDVSWDSDQYLCI